MSDDARSLLPVQGTSYTVELIDGDAWVILNHAGEYGNGWMTEPPSAEPYGSVRDLIQSEDHLHRAVVAVEAVVDEWSGRAPDEPNYEMWKAIRAALDSTVGIRAEPS